MSSICIGKSTREGAYWFLPPFHMKQCYSEQYQQIASIKKAAIQTLKKPSKGSSEVTESSIIVLVKRISSTHVYLYR